MSKNAVPRVSAHADTSAILAQIDEIVKPRHCNKLSRSYVIASSNPGIVTFSMFG